jgi:sugar fermentation stimulation protein A
VKEAVAEGVARELQGYDAIRQEVRYGAGKSRIDLLLTRQGGAESCFVEVKNVTAAVAEGIALFPDAVTVRGTRHLRELMGVVRDGQRAVLFFCIQRRDVREVRPADVIDPVYGRTLREALRSGVEVIAYRAEVGLGGIQLCTPVPVVCP